MNTQIRKKRFFWIVLLLSLFFSVRESLVTSAETGSSASLVINEFVADNETGLTDEDGEHADWIELYNQSSSPINLAGWALTDAADNPTKWTFPDFTLGGRQYLVVFASGKNRQGGPAGAALHTNFKLKQEGEFLGLYHVLEDRFVDELVPQYPPQFRDRAYGRYGANLAYGFLARPTPGGPNDQPQVWAGTVAPVEFSAERGFYEGQFKLRLTTSTLEATIRYTADGSEPTETNGQLYTEPVVVESTAVIRAAAFKPGFLPSGSSTRSYLFLQDVLAQPSNPPGFPHSWGAQLTTAPGYTTAAPAPADYGMDPHVVNDPRYRDSLKDDLQSLPTLSVVMAPASFADLYSHPGDEETEWEQPVSLEFIYPDSQQDFQINAGLKLRGDFTAKPSFRLLFKHEYGPTKLDYPLFPDSPVKEFDSLLLRAASLADMREGWLRASQNAMSGLSPHNIFAHLYLNGLYWGVYNVVERPDASFMSTYGGGEKAEWFLADQAGPLDHEEGSAADPLPYLFTALSYNDAFDGGDQLSQVYTTTASYLDPAQFSDFMILNWYAESMHWPRPNWRFAVQRQDSPGHGKFLVWDEAVSEPAETALSSGAELTPVSGVEQALLKVLLQNPDFKMQLADRMYRHLFNDGALSPAQAQARWRQQSQPLARAIVADLARWGNARPDVPTQEEWGQAQAEVAQRMAGAAEQLVVMARGAGYYPKVDPPLFSHAGGLVEPGFTLTLSLPQPAPGATIYYTTDSSDPRMPVTGEVGPTAVAYHSPVALTANTVVKARVWDGREWSALNQASFSVVAQDNGLRLTEIMYNPSEGDDLEFIELKNIGKTELSLAGVSVVEGVYFNFPPDTPPLGPGQFAVLVSNPTAFAEYYPNVPVSGVYEGHLSNKGEKITLVDAAGETLIEVEYNDEYGWPVSADGRGDSLRLINEAGNPSDSLNWRASTYPGGSPGADEPGVS